MSNGNISTTKVVARLKLLTFAVRIGILQQAERAKPKPNPYTLEEYTNQLAKRGIHKGPLMLHSHHH